MTSRIVWTEMKLLTREPLTLLVSLLFPIVLMVLLVGSFGNEPDETMGGIGGTDFYVPVYAAATIAVMGLLGIPTHLAGYRHDGVLRRFRAAGAPPAAVMAAQIAVTAAIVGVGTGAMLGLGFGVYDLSRPASPGGVAVGFAVGTLAFSGLGLFLGAVLPTARAAQGLGLLLFFGLFFIAGGGPPPSLLPDIVNTAIDFTPMGPLVSAIADPWHGHGWNGAALAALAVMGTVGLLLAGRRLARA